VRFRVTKKHVNIRDARIDDSESLSLLQWEYLQKYRTIDGFEPKTPEKYRMAIGSSLLHGNHFLVAEDDTEEVIGFVEQKKQNTRYVKIGYPYVSLSHPKRKDIQYHLLSQMLQRMKEIGVQYVSTEFSENIRSAYELFSSIGFGNTKVIFQSWEGDIVPSEDIDVAPYEVRRVKHKDLDVSYSWISRQLDKMSPLNITKSTYKELLMAPKDLREGWAMATLDDHPVAMISSLKDEATNTIVIFGPYCEAGHENIRIPLLNELLLYHRMRGYETARLLRIKPFDNDTELFKRFNFEKTEEIILMSKKL
jgi:ribosomal protein S18 acetylase RimI-like enzyme